jgi:hypothetical protein
MSSVAAGLELRRYAPSGSPPSVAATEPVPLTFLFNFVKPYRVRVVSTSGGNHVPTSYHYRHRAIDVAGSAESMDAVARAALNHPQAFREVFYDPLGKYVKNGVVRHGAIGGHADHVHLAR